MDQKPVRKGRPMPRRQKAEAAVNCPECGAPRTTDGEICRVCTPREETPREICWTEVARYIATASNGDLVQRSVWVSPN